MWDNAYCIHEISDTPDVLLNIMDECKKTGNEDLPILFCSTSKITFPGAGVAAMAASENNLKVLREKYNYEIISYDKLNMLRHVRFFKDYDGVLKHMEKHKSVLKPKFEIVLDTLDKELAPADIASWKKPHGGYFVSVDVLKARQREQSLFVRRQELFLRVQVQHIRSELIQRIPTSELHRPSLRTTSLKLLWMFFVSVQGLRLAKRF